MKPKIVAITTDDHNNVKLTVDELNEIINLFYEYGHKDGWDEGYECGKKCEDKNIYFNPCITHTEPNPLRYDHITCGDITATNTATNTAVEYHGDTTD